jgi:hypothetical protein
LEKLTLDGAIQFVDVEGCPHLFNPPNGTLPLEITLEGPRPVLVSVTLRNRVLRLEPTVKNDDGKSIPFRLKNMEDILHEVMKAGRTAEDHLGELKAERDRRKASLRVPMHYRRYIAINSRIAELDLLIPQAENKLNAIKIELEATQRLLDFASNIHGKCTVTVEEIADSDDLKQRAETSEKRSLISRAVP